MTESNNSQEKSPSEPCKISSFYSAEVCWMDLGSPRTKLVGFQIATATGTLRKSGHLSGMSRMGLCYSGARSQESGLTKPHLTGSLKEA